MGTPLLINDFETNGTRVTRCLRALSDGTYRVTTLLRLPSGCFYNDPPAEFGSNLKAGCCCPLNTDRRAYGADRSRNRDR